MLDLLLSNLIFIFSVKGSVIFQLLYQVQIFYLILVVSFIINLIIRLYF